MVDGFWIVQYEGMQGNGGGVVTFIGGHVFGGDSGSTYIGTYHRNGTRLHATVKIHNYMPNVVSIIGMEGDYELEVVGNIENDIIKASGTPVGHRAAGMALRLTKRANLPI